MKEVFENIVEILENKANEAEKDMQLSDSSQRLYLCYFRFMQKGVIA